MAGSGRRVFQPGEVLTASNVMNYLQDQAVMSFAGTAARGSAIGTAAAAGMTTFLKDTNLIQVHDGTAYRSIGGVTRVASATVRDALFPSPIQGDKIFRNDLGVIETYYALYNSSTNPGGATPAGWYPDRAIGIATRKGNVAFTLASGVYQNISSTTYWDSAETRGGVSDYSNGWTIPFTGVWKVTFSIVGAPNAVLAPGFKINDTTTPGAWSQLYGTVVTVSGNTSFSGGTVVRKFNAGDVLTMFMYSSASGNWPSETAVDAGRWVIEFIGPAK